MDPTRPSVLRPSSGGHLDKTQLLILPAYYYKIVPLSRDSTSLPTRLQQEVTVRGGSFFITALKSRQPPASNRVLAVTEEGHKVSCNLRQFFAPYITRAKIYNGAAFPPKTKIDGFIKEKKNGLESSHFDIRKKPTVKTSVNLSYLFFFFFYFYPPQGGRSS